MPRGIINPGTPSYKSMSGRTKRVIRANVQPQKPYDPKLVYISDLAVNLITIFHYRYDKDWAVTHGKSSVTYAKTAQAIGVSGEIVSRWMSGKSPMPISAMDGIMRVLGVTVEDLLSNEDLTLTVASLTPDERIQALKPMITDLDLDLMSITQEAGKMKPTMARRIRTRMGTAFNKLDAIYHILGLDRTEIQEEEPKPLPVKLPIALKELADEGM